MFRLLYWSTSRTPSFHLHWKTISLNISLYSSRQYAQCKIHLLIDQILEFLNRFRFTIFTTCQYFFAVIDPYHSISCIDEKTTKTIKVWYLIRLQRFPKIRCLHNFKKIQYTHKNQQPELQYDFSCRYNNFGGQYNQFYNNKTKLYIHKFEWILF